MKRINRDRNLPKQGFEKQDRKSFCFEYDIWKKQERATIKPVPKIAVFAGTPKDREI